MVLLFMSTDKMHFFSHRLRVRTVSTGTHVQELHRTQRGPRREVGRLVRHTSDLDLQARLVRLLICKLERPWKCQPIPSQRPAGAFGGQRTASWPLASSDQVDLAVGGGSDWRHSRELAAAATGDRRACLFTPRKKRYSSAMRCREPTHAARN
jgi:hypothetical protein